MSIASNIEKIEERILRACRVSGRKRGEITLMAVTKFLPLPAIEDAWNAGIRVFGESKVREGVEKFSAFRENRDTAVVHLIGNLQRNKAKAAIDFFDCIQSVDRTELIHELAKYARLRTEPADILLEFHTAEESKSGFPDIDSLCRAVETVLACPNLRIRGLMTMAPFTADQRLIRESFRQASAAKNVLEQRFPSAPCEAGAYSWGCLSMGMSGDFEIAVEEGSTMLRIGSAIFTEER